LSNSNKSAQRYRWWYWVTRVNFNFGELLRRNARGCVQIFFATRSTHQDLGWRFFLCANKCSVGGGITRQVSSFSPLSYHKVGGVPLCSIHFLSEPLLSLCPTTHVTEKVCVPQCTVDVTGAGALNLFREIYFLERPWIKQQQGRAIAQAVSRRLLTAAARVQNRVWSCGILWWTKVALGQVS
jgi:hypothetical protein